MNPDRYFSKIENLLQDGIRNQVFTAAQTSWCIEDMPPLTICVGNTQAGPVTENTRFDIASLTKLFAASACLRLISRKRIHLETPLHSLISLSAQFEGATLSHLLAHEAGFDAWQPLFEAVPIGERATPSSRSRIIHQAVQSPCEHRPGSAAVYSDLGYIVLLEILEKISHRNLREIVRNEVSRPLGLFQTDFRPIAAAPAEAKIDFAPTELCPWRQKRLVGEVHDDNAWSMGGVAAHAGIFSTASALAKFGAAWLKTMRNSAWLPKEIAELAIQRRPSGRGLGWDLKSETSSSAGAKMSGLSFGHLGYTGCSLWVDPTRNISIALLTNRVYFGRENDKIRSFRPVFHDAVIDGAMGTVL